MNGWPRLPSDVISWFRSAFVETNRQVTELIDNLPNVRETSLDDRFAESLLVHSAPTLLPSDSVVSMHVHNIGGLRRLHKWETADIAVLVFVYLKGRPIARKIGLLQTKRLYPENLQVDDEDPVGFRYGLNALIHPDPSRASAALHREFRFTERCRYAAFDDDQLENALRFNANFGEAIYYLFYNPSDLPLTIRYPLTARRSVLTPLVGGRVSRVIEVESAVSRLRSSNGPTRRTIQGHSLASDWRLEHWAADLLLTCQVGRLFDALDEEMIESMIVRRSGPIGAVLSTSIELAKEPTA